jgi:hypothetical protein
LEYWVWLSDCWDFLVNSWAAMLDDTYSSEPRYLFWAMWQLGWREEELTGFCLRLVENKLRLNLFSNCSHHQSLQVFSSGSLLSLFLYLLIDFLGFLIIIRMKVLQIG